MSSTPEAEHVEAITRAMSAWQGVRLELCEGGKHPYVKIFVGDRWATKVLSSSTANQMSRIRAVTDVKRIARELGAVPPARPTSSRIRRRRAPPRPTKFTVADQVETAPDPLAPLEQVRIVQMSALVQERWGGTYIKRDRLDEAARTLAEGWHPDVVLRAADLIRAARKQA